MRALLAIAALLVATAAIAAQSVSSTPQTAQGAVFLQPELPPWWAANELEPAAHLWETLDELEAILRNEHLRTFDTIHHHPGKGGLTVQAIYIPAGTWTTVAGSTPLGHGGSIRPPAAGEGYGALAWPTEALHVPVICPEDTPPRDLPPDVDEEPLPPV